VGSCPRVWRPFAPCFASTEGGQPGIPIETVPVSSVHAAPDQKTAGKLTRELDSGMRSRVDTGDVDIGKALRSGELAKATGVSPDTIRHYEKIGVIPRASRTESGYRLYPESAVERVVVVQRALRIGFTLAELADVLKARDAGGAPCQRVYKLATAKLKGVTADIAALKQTERYLKQVLTDWEGRMRRTAPGQKSNLLHSLTRATNGDRAPTKFRRKKP
jgi:MerR family copper efflux transcriptional regulator